MAEAADIPGGEKMLVTSGLSTTLGKERSLRRRGACGGGEPAEERSVRRRGGEGSGACGGQEREPNSAPE
jgi:hypothetical protein